MPQMLSVLLVSLGSAAAYWTLEHGVNPTIHNFGDALYWSFITATTVGHGNITPAQRRLALSRGR